MSPVRLYTIGNNYFVIAGNGGAAARNLSRTRAGGEGRRGGGVGFAAGILEMVGTIRLTNGLLVAYFPPGPV